MSLHTVGTLGISHFVWFGTSHTMQPSAGLPAVLEYHLGPLQIRIKADVSLPVFTPLQWKRSHSPLNTSHLLNGVLNYRPPCFFPPSSAALKY